MYTFVTNQQNVDKISVAVTRRKTDEIRPIREYIGNCRWWSKIGYMVCAAGKLYDQIHMDILTLIVEGNILVIISGREKQTIMPILGRLWTKLIWPSRPWNTLYGQCVTTHPPHTHILLWVLFYFIYTSNNVSF